MFVLFAHEKGGGFDERASLAYRESGERDARLEVLTVTRALRLGHDI